MEIPDNLLPIHVMKDGFGRHGPLPHHTLYSVKDDLIYLANVYKDNLICDESSVYDSLALAGYLAVCANNFPKAIELLKESVKFMNLVHNNKYGNNYALCTEIDSFLNNLDE
jgi:hypothetical protein